MEVRNESWNCSLGLFHSHAFQNACHSFPTSDFSRILVDRKWTAYSGDSGMVISNKIAHNLNKMLFVNVPLWDTSNCKHLKILCDSMNLCSSTCCLQVFLSYKLNNLHTGLPEPFSNHNRQPWRVIHVKVDHFARTWSQKARWQCVTPDTINMTMQMFSKMKTAKYYAKPCKLKMV